MRLWNLTQKCWHAWSTGAVIVAGFAPLDWNPSMVTFPSILAGNLTQSSLFFFLFLHLILWQKFKIWNWFLEEWGFIRKKITWFISARDFINGSTHVKSNLGMCIQLNLNDFVFSVCTLCGKVLLDLDASLHVIFADKNADKSSTMYNRRGRNDKNVQPQKQETVSTLIFFSQFCSFCLDSVDFVIEATVECGIIFFMNVCSLTLLLLSGWCCIFCIFCVFCVHLFFFI